MENKIEGWVKFQRFTCKEGYIDRWVGDCIDDPNRSTKNNIHLNTMATYFRLNGEGLWIHRRDFNNPEVYIGEFKDDYSAKEIWEIMLK
jgi:hypothetical protein